MTDWVTYISQEEDVNYGRCYEHRLKHGLSIEDADSLECETECSVYGTCPHYRVSIEEMDDYEQRMRDLFPPEE